MGEMEKKHGNYRVTMQLVRDSFHQGLCPAEIYLLLAGFLNISR